MRDQMILRIVARLNIPFMVVFGLYVITHGEIGPGGGFQGGVILAAGFLLYGLVYSAEEMRKILPRRITDFVAGLGVLIYAGEGIFAMLNGYEFLDHTWLIPSDPGAAEPWGMTIVEYGVGLTVAAVMITIFNEITEGTIPEGTIPEGTIPESTGTHTGPSSGGEPVPETRSAH